MKETSTRKIINNFIDKRALSEEEAITIEDIKVDIKENEKNYIINSLIQSKYLVKTENERMWFDESQWNKSINKLILQYSFIISMPIVIAFILYLIFF